MGTAMTFEEALKRLEEIVARMEGGELSLDESLRVFEDGVGLARFCETKLNEAEKKVEMLVKDKNGRLSAVPFAAMDTSADDEGV